jgi:hypothetical protein
VAKRRATSANGQMTLAIVVGGVGIAGLAAGSALGMTARSNWNEAVATCNRGDCSRGNAKGESAGRMADFATAGFVVGAAGILGGAVLWLTAPTSSRSMDRVSVVPSLGTSTGLTIQGFY